MIGNSTFSVLFLFVSCHKRLRGEDRMLVFKYLFLGVGLLIPFIFLFQYHDNSVFQTSTYNALLALIPLGIFSLLHKKTSESFDRRPIMGIGIFLCVLVYFCSPIIGHGVMTMIILSFIVSGIFGLMAA